MQNTKETTDWYSLTIKMVDGKTYLDCKWFAQPDDEWREMGRLIPLSLKGLKRFASDEQNALCQMKWIVLAGERFRAMAKRAGWNLFSEEEPKELAKPGPCRYCKDTGLLSTGTVFIACECYAASRFDPKARYRADGTEIS